MKKQEVFLRFESVGKVLLLPEVQGQGYSENHECIWNGRPSHGLRRLQDLHLGAFLLLQCSLQFHHNYQLELDLHFHFDSEILFEHMLRSRANIRRVVE